MGDSDVPSVLAGALVSVGEYELGLGRGSIVGDDISWAVAPIAATNKDKKLLIITSIAIDEKLLLPSL